MENIDYIISGGKEGKSRLNILSETLYPYTRPLLEAQGVSPGHSFLDLGCGGGNVAQLAARLVGDTGTVTAVDFDETIITLAQQDAAASGLMNISFEAQSVHDIHYANRFDFAYARFLLSHLRDPFSALQRMIHSVKPGGKIIVEDVRFSGHFCYPQCEAFDQYVQYYTIAAHNNGHNAEIGPTLFSLFLQAGLQQVGFDVVLPSFNTGAGKWMAFITLDKIKNTLIHQGIASVEIINVLQHELEEFTNDQQTIMSLPAIFRVWGTRPLK